MYVKTTCSSVYHRPIGLWNTELHVVFLSIGEVNRSRVLFNPLPTNEAYMCHGCSHFFYKAIGLIYMGGLTLDASTLYVDFCHFTYIAMVDKG